MNIALPLKGGITLVEGSARQAGIGFTPSSASVITPKPARHDHFKTGQPQRPRTTCL
jgi:hypothetical protein